METFKYYKRGKGELDTSNFPDIMKSGTVLVDNLDEKTFVSLLALNMELSRNSFTNSKVTVYVNGYVAHMRADKDYCDPAELYQYLNCLNIRCMLVQHDSRHGIITNLLSEAQIDSDLNLTTNMYQTVGADSSVYKFFPDVQCQAHKIREEGKVTDLVFEVEWMAHEDDEVDVVIVDDILGGGATVQKLFDIIHKECPNKKIHLWVSYNEGIHTEEFLNQFDSVYIGEEI